MINMVNQGRSYSCRTRMPFLLSLLLFVGASLLGAAAVDDGDQEDWQRCDIFMAPSALGGWGVFAGRDFEKGEIVELAPLMLTVSEFTSEIQSSALLDYVFAYDRYNYGGYTNRAFPLEDEHKYHTRHLVRFGYGSFLNHQPGPNLLTNCYGHEPRYYESMFTYEQREEFFTDEDYDYQQKLADTEVMCMCGFTASRDIRAGEELFTTYTGNEADDYWFTSRDLEMKVAPTRKGEDGEEQPLFFPPEQLKELKEEFCAHSHAGIGSVTWDKFVMFTLGKLVLSTTEQRHRHRQRGDALPQDDFGLEHAISKHDVGANQRVELAPMVIFSKKIFRNSLLAPLLILWDELDATQQHTLKLARQKYGTLHIQFQGLSTYFRRKNAFRTYEEVALFPVGGNIAMMKRVGGTDEEANCKLVIHPTYTPKSNASLVNEGKPWTAMEIVLEVVALRDLKKGETLKLDLARSQATDAERRLLAYELHVTGQEKVSPLPER